MAATTAADAAHAVAGSGLAGALVPDWLLLKLSGFLEPGAAPIVVIIFAGVMTLYALNLLYLLVTPKTARHPEHSAHSERRVRQEANQFKPATSRLDTRGGLLLSWHTPRPLAMGDSDVQGWLNLMIVVLITYCMSNAVMNQREVGSMFADGGGYARGLLKYAPRLFLDVLALVAAYAAFCLGFQYGVHVGVLRGTMGHVVQALGEAALFLGPIAYARTGERLDWPVTQRLGLLMEATVLVMKAHSYISVNRHLRREVALGGPGTGTLVAAADKELMRSARHADGVGNAALAGSPRSSGSASAAAAGETQTAGQGSTESRDGAGGTTTSTSAGNASGEHPAAASAQAAVGPAPGETRPPTAAQAAVGPAPGETRDTSADGAIAATSSGGTSGGDDTSGTASLRQRRRGGLPQPVGLPASPPTLPPAGSGTSSSPPPGTAPSPETTPSFHWRTARETGNPVSVALSRAWCLLSNAACLATRELRADAAVDTVEAAALAGRLSGSTMRVTHRTPLWQRICARCCGDAVPSPAEGDAAAPAAAAAAAAASAGGTGGPAHAPRLAMARLGASTRNLLTGLIWGTDAQGRPTSLARVAWPHNVTLADFVSFTAAPVLVYEPNYPRTQSVSAAYVAEKVLLALVLVTAGVHVVSAHHLPVLAKALEMDALEALMRLALPTLGLLLIVWLVSFECVANAAAELTRFADRSFYDDWQASSSFAEFSRRWNRPVSEWLLRTVYLGSRASLGVAATPALFLTFGVSIVAHELVLYGTLGPTAPYLALFSLLQFPLLSLMRVPWVRGRRLGNILFWASILAGVTAAIVLYARDYTARARAAAVGGGV